MLKRLPAKTVWVVAMAAIACSLLIYERDFLWKVQEMNLFLNSTLFLKEQLVVSGGFLSWLGTFFTQFFYYPWLGVLMLCGWWLLLMWLLQRTFHIPDRWIVLTLIPVALLLLTIVDTGYWVYMLKMRGFVFAGTIGTTAVVALLWGFRSLPDKWMLRPLYIFLACVAGYVLIGIYGLAATLLMGIFGWKVEGGRRNALVCSVVALLSAVAVPLLCYRYVFYQTNLANIYYTGLPLYYITEDYQAYYLPFYLLALFFVLLVIIPISAVNPIVAKSPKKSKLLTRPLIIQVVLLAILIFGVVHFWYKDENFHHEVAMQHAIERLDWEGVLNDARQQKDEPTRAIVMMRNLALSRLGRQGDEMFLYRNGSRSYEAPFGMRLMLVSGPLIYYQYGMLNYCNRLCTEMCVEFGWRAEYIKLLVNCAILHGEPQLARKYIGVLKQTTFFDDWAEHAEQLLNNPELIAQDAAREPITHMMHYGNTLNSDQGYIERFLMQQLAYSNYTDDPVFQEQALLATLWTHDINLFWRRFSDFVRLHPNSRIPRFYQEAAYLYGKLEERNNLDRMPFDNYIRDGFDRFMQFAMQYDDVDVEIAREALFPSFGQTYYYDYYTMSQLPEY